MKDGTAMYVFLNMKKLLSREALCVAAAVLLTAALAFVRYNEPMLCVVSSDTGYYLPVIMYHSVLKDGAMQGRYVVSPEQLENDLKYLSENGYTAVTVADLIAYVDEGTPLPDKPVMLTFDDGYYNNYLYVYPLMKKYGFKMVLSIIGKYAELYSETKEINAYYTHCTWDQLKEMTESGYVEIQNHSYDMHSTANGRSGSKRLPGESLETYRLILTNDIEKCQDLLFKEVGVTATTFAYPFGAISDDSDEIIRDLGFRASFSCEQKMNLITRDPECLYRLKRFLRPSGKDSAAYFENTVHIDRYVNITE